MADVDQCAREAELGIVNDPQKHAGIIASLDNSLRVKFFRNKNKEQIAKDLIKAKNEIISSIYSSFHIDNSFDIILCNSSDNNRVGADLYCFLDDGTRLDIEVKFGAKTDHAIGMDAFASIFGTSAFSKAASVEKRKLWKSLFSQEYP